MQGDLHRTASTIDFPTSWGLPLQSYLFKLFIFTLHSRFLFQPLAPRLTPPRTPSCIKKLLIDNFFGGALSISWVLCTNVFLNTSRFYPQGYFLFWCPFTWLERGKSYVVFNVFLYNISYIILYIFALEIWSH